jgi:hypothetical protein
MSRLSITTGCVATIAYEVAAWGARDVETGGFLLGGDDGRLATVALSARVGITRRRDLFVVSGRAIAGLFAYANERGLAVRAQFHSHAQEAFLSKSDLTHGFGVDGFITCVLPTYASPPRDAAGWGWWVYRRAWTPTAAPLVARGEALVVRFDEGGARET